MAPSIHVRVRGLFAFACWLLALVVLVVIYCCWVTGPDEPSGFWRMIAILGIVVLATLLTAILTETVFWILLPARCSRCSKRMSSRRERTIVYRCRACGYEFDTGWSTCSGGGGLLSDSSGGGGDCSGGDGG